MLGYKVWCETRTRLAIAAAAVIAACGLVMAQGDRHGLTFASYVWSAAYNDSVKTVFVLLAMVLGSGSLRQEQAVGTAGFTLALPVSRRRILAVRAGVGIVEVIALAGFAGLLISVLSWAADGDAAVLTSLRFVVLWSVCGALLVSLSLLASIVIASEYVGWLATVLALMAYEGVIHVTALRRVPLCDPFYLMSVGGGGLPWVALLGVGVAAGVLLAIGHLRLRKRDF